MRVQMVYEGKATLYQRIHSRKKQCACKLPPGGTVTTILGHQMKCPFVHPFRTPSGNFRFLYQLLMLEGEGWRPAQAREFVRDTAL